MPEFSDREVQRQRERSGEINRLDMSIAKLEALEHDSFSKQIVIAQLKRRRAKVHIDPDDTSRLRVVDLAQAPPEPY